LAMMADSKLGRRSTRVERKKPGRKRSQEPQSQEPQSQKPQSQEPQKGIGSWIKDNAALVTAIGALVGVLITGAFNTYIANKDQLAQQQLELTSAEKQAALEQENAQETALQTYLTDIGKLLLDDSSPLREATADDEVSRLARAKTLTVLLGLDGPRKRILLQFLNEEELINVPNPIVSLSNADLSGDLRGVDFNNAGLTNALVTEEQLRQAKSLENVAMPNGQRYED
jgi:hypothetical protein